MRFFRASIQIRGLSYYTAHLIKLHNSGTHHVGLLSETDAPQWLQSPPNGPIHEPPHS